MAQGEAHCGWAAPSPCSHPSFPVSTTGEIGTGSAWRPEQPPLSPALCNLSPSLRGCGRIPGRQELLRVQLGLGNSSRSTGEPQAPSCTLSSLPPNLSKPSMPPELGWGGQMLLRADLTAWSCFDAKFHPDASRKSRELQQPGVILGPSASPQSCLKTQTLGISLFY